MQALRLPAVEDLRLKQLASILTQKALFQAEAMERVLQICSQNASFRNPCDFYQEKDKPLRCTYTHKVEGVRPAKRWVLNVAAVQRKAGDQVAAISSALEACRSALHNGQGGVGSDRYSGPTSAEDFFEDQDGELCFRYRWNGGIGEEGRSQMTMRAAVVRRHHRRGIEGGGEGPG